MATGEILQQQLTAIENSDFKKQLVTSIATIDVP
jgi:hypothetical protein